MNIALTRPVMTRDEFMAWALAQEGKFEFDGKNPVAMTYVSRNHSWICQTILRLLYARLLGTGFQALGPESPIYTIDEAVRCPDVVVTGTSMFGTDYVVPEPTVVFEVISPNTAHIDRGEKVREYQALPSMRCYVIVDTAAVGVQVFSRAEFDADWIESKIGRGRVLFLPIIGTELAVSDIYEGVALS